MTGFDYTKAVATAQRLIARFGQRAYLRKAGEATGDAYNPTLDNARDWPITVVDLNRQIRDAAGALVAGAGRSLFVSTEGLDLVTLEKADTIMIGPGEFPDTMTEHEIAEVRPLSPGGVVVMYSVDLVH